MKQYNDKIYFINVKVKFLHSLTMNTNEDKFESTLILSDFVNDYFITNDKIFVEKASNLNGIQVLNVE